jgi:hypothetical protein
MTYSKEGIPKHQYHVRTSHNNHIKKRILNKHIEEFSIKKAPLSYKVRNKPFFYVTFENYSLIKILISI